MKYNKKNYKNKCFRRKYLKTSKIRGCGNRNKNKDILLILN